MNPGCVQGKRVGYSEIYEAIGQYSNGEIGDDVIKDYENNACPTCGSYRGRVYREAIRATHSR